MASESRSERRERVRKKKFRQTLLSIVFLLPGLVILAGNILNGTIDIFQIPKAHLVIALLSLSASLAIGWGPAMDMWTGRNAELYVNEPEVDDEWE